MKQNCGGDKKMLSRKLLLAFALLAMVVACNPKSEFVESPVGATAVCEINPSAFTVTGGGEGKGRVTATVSNATQPINNAAVTITLGNVGSFRDPGNGQDLLDSSGAFITDFRTQTNAQGRVQIDLVCPGSGNTDVGSFACVATFDFGTARCSATFTTTRT